MRLAVALMCVAVPALACDDVGISPRAYYLGSAPTRSYQTTVAPGRPKPGQPGYVPNCSDEMAATHPTMGSVAWIAKHCQGRNE